MRVYRFPAHLTPPLGAYGGTPGERLLEVVDEAKAWAVIQGLQLGYQAAEQIVLRVTPQTLSEAYFATPVGLVIYAALHAGNARKAEELLSDQKRAALAAVRMNHDKIVKLKTVLFEAAKAGKFPDGRAYSWTQWRGFAQDITNDLLAQVKFQGTNTYLVNVVKLLGDMVISTVKVVDKAADIPTTPPSKWPWWIWAGGGLAGLGVLAYATNTFRTFLPAPRGR